MPHEQPSDKNLAKLTTQPPRSLHTHVGIYLYIPLSGARVCAITHIYTATRGEQVFENIVVNPPAAHTFARASAICVCVVGHRLKCAVVPHCWACKYHTHTTTASSIYIIYTKKRGRENNKHLSGLGLSMRIIRITRKCSVTLEMYS